MIAHLFNISNYKKNKDLPKDSHNDDFGGMKISFRTQRYPSIDDVHVIKQSLDIFYPTRGVITVGLLLSTIGLLLFSPFHIPVSYRFIGGVGFFIMGISVIGNGFINSRKKKHND